MYLYMSVFSVLHVNILYTTRAHLYHAIFITARGKIKVTKLYIEIPFVKSVNKLYLKKSNLQTERRTLNVTP